MNEEDVKTCITCLHYKGPQNEYVAQMQNTRQEPECLHPKALRAIS